MQKPDVTQHSPTLPIIHSKPSYVPLAWDPEGRTHVLAAQGDGGERLLRLLAVSPRHPIAVRYAPDPLAASDWSAPLAQAAAGTYMAFDSVAALLDGLRVDFEAGRMGLRLYLAGSEHFVWSASRIAASFGLCADEIRREHCGSQARAVYCVHCKTIAQQVRTNVVTCPGCARNLMVRDHYSARLVAYMGFQIDAEVPGALPAIESPYA